MAAPKNIGAGPQKTSAPSRLGPSNPARATPDLLPARRTRIFPLAVFQGTGQFQDIGKGDTMDGKCWPAINGHSNYARIYRIVSIRHTLTTAPSGQVTHLKSLFVETVVPPRAEISASRSQRA